MPLPAIIFGAAFWTAITGAVTTAITWIFRKAIISFLLVTALFLLLDFLTPVLLRLISNYSAINPVALMNGIPPGVWFFASIFKLDLGAKVIISAYTTRFLIRRIPFIG